MQLFETFPSDHYSAYKLANSQWKLDYANASDKSFEILEDS